MRFTDSSMFVGDVFIPNLNTECNGITFTEYIMQKEDECLRHTLGECLYNELIANMEYVDGSYRVKPDADDKYKWLANGHTYTGETCNRGCTQLTWSGISKTISAQINETQEVRRKLSYPMYYIYWQWALNTDTITAGTGEVIANTVASSRASNIYKRVNAYNAFVHWISHVYNGSVGLYKYLYDHCELYQNWSGKRFTYESAW